MPKPTAPISARGDHRILIFPNHEQRSDHPIVYIKFASNRIALKKKPSAWDVGTVGAHRISDEPLVGETRYEDYDDVIVSKNEAYDAFKVDQSSQFIVLLLCCVILVAFICGVSILYFYMEKKENDTIHNQV